MCRWRGARLKSELQYDPVTHTYRVNGKRLPSVTGIIQTVIPRKWNADEWCMNRGTMVHKALALHMSGCLDIDTVDPRIIDRVNAGIMAAKAYGWAPAMIEPPMAHPVMLYAGTPDMITQCGCVVDWKATCEEVVEIQLGFYALLGKANGINIKKLYAIQTRDNGFKAYPYDVKRASALAVAFYGVYGWLKKNEKPLA